ncbi:hypothetical protein SLG_14160 [Sphingobium sp. SYK-6]|nr:hypothetical protein SLG_14160 [Sphingobium sp. SYK-6]
MRQNAAADKCAAGLGRHHPFEGRPGSWYRGGMERGVDIRLPCGVSAGRLLSMIGPCP